MSSEELTSKQPLSTSVTEFFGILALDDIHLEFPPDHTEAREKGASAIREMASILDSLKDLEKLDPEYLPDDDEEVDEDRTQEDFVEAMAAAWEKIKANGPPFDALKPPKDKDSSTFGDWTGAIEDLVFADLASRSKFQLESGDTVDLVLSKNPSDVRACLKRQGLDCTPAGFQQFVDNAVRDAMSVKTRLLSPGNREALEIFGLGNLDGCRIDFRPFEADAHGFAPPMKCLIRTVDGQEKALMCKSRPGIADKAVTDTFKRINDAGGVRGLPLPFYDQTLLHDGSLVSEFIEGTPGRAKASPEQGIGNVDMATKFPAPDFDATAIRNSIRALELFARAVGLTDLHEDNVVIQRDRVVPIDLEAFSLGDNTGLFGHVPRHQVNALLGVDKELNETDDPGIWPAIMDFAKIFDTVDRRLVPVPTSDYLDLLSHAELETRVEGAFQATVEGFARKGYSGTGDLKGYITWCAGETPPVVPMFVVNRKRIYPGSNSSRAEPVGELTK